MFNVVDAGRTVIVEMKVSRTPFCARSHIPLGNMAVDGIALGNARACEALLGLPLLPPMDTSP
jgi:hypothetical protein